MSYFCVQAVVGDVVRRTGMLASWVDAAIVAGHLNRTGIQCGVAPAVCCVALTYDAQLDEVVREYLQLRRSGGANHTVRTCSLQWAITRGATLL